MKVSSLSLFLTMVTSNLSSGGVAVAQQQNMDQDGLAIHPLADTNNNIDNWMRIADRGRVVARGLRKKDKAPKGPKAPKANKKKKGKNPTSAPSISREPIIRVAIGARYNDGIYDDEEDDRGHVRVYDLVDDAWTKVGDDIDGEAADDRSGSSVSLSSDGSTVAIGAPRNDGNGSNSGHVRVYKLIDNAWTKLGDDINGEAVDDQSGGSVSLSSDGSIVAVGAPYDDGNGLDSGHVRVYKLIDNVWTKLGDDIDGEAVNDVSGVSVSLSDDGTVVAIGASGNDGNGDVSGHVRVYKLIDNAWTKLGDDIDGEDLFDNSGRSVSLSDDGSVVAIGAYGNDGNGDVSGHVRVYQLIGGTWTKLGDDIDGEAAGDRSGWSVSLSDDGSIVAIGAPENDGNGSNSGHVRVYKLIGSTWTKLGDDIDGEAGNDEFGKSISLSSDGSIVAVGAPYDDGIYDDSDIDSGRVRVYKLIDNAWTQVGGDIDGEDVVDNFGWSISLAVF